MPQRFYRFPPFSAVTFLHEVVSASHLSHLPGIPSVPAVGSFHGAGSAAVLGTPCVWAGALRATRAGRRSASRTRGSRGGGHGRCQAWCGHLTYHLPTWVLLSSAFQMLDPTWPKPCHPHPGETPSFPLLVSLKSAVHR